MKNSSLSLRGIHREIPLNVLRGIMDLIFITHGVARLFYASIPDFREFLNSRGFFIGEIIVWLITKCEIIGGMLLITGFLVKYVVIFHFIILLTGIFLVHLLNGWFVVGHGKNGVEYSILVLIYLFYSSENNLRRS